MKKHYSAPEAKIHEVRINSILNSVSNVPIGGEGESDGKKNSSKVFNLSIYFNDIEEEDND